MTRLVRKHAHDVRNHLNAIELGATLIGEIGGEDPDIDATVKQIQQQLTQTEAALKSLVMKFAAPGPSPGPVPAAGLLEFSKQRLDAESASIQTIEWPAEVDGTCLLAVDMEPLAPLFCELILAAVRRSSGKPLKISLLPEPSAVLLELREAPQNSPPPAETLEEAAWIIRRLGGELVSFQDPESEEWVTRLTLPAYSGTGKPPE